MKQTTVDSMFTTAPEATLALVRGELSAARRWGYRLVFAVAATMVAALASLWATEPGPLPMRLHVAFAVMIAIGLGWVSVSGWILLRHRCPTALDRIASCWMATIACAISLVVSVAIALFRGQHLAALTLAILGISLEVVAVVLLRNAYAFREHLRSRLAEINAMERD